MWIKQRIADDGNNCCDEDYGGQCYQAPHRLSFDYGTSKRSAPAGADLSIWLPVPKRIQSTQKVQKVQKVHSRLVPHFCYCLFYSSILHTRHLQIPIIRQRLTGCGSKGTE